MAAIFFSYLNYSLKEIAHHLLFPFLKCSFFFKIPKENEQKRPRWAQAFGILLWLQPSAVSLLSAPFIDAEGMPASHQFPLYLLKGLAPSSLLSYPCHLPYPTCSQSMPARIRRKQELQDQVSSQPLLCMHRPPEQVPAVPERVCSTKKTLMALASVESMERSGRSLLSSPRAARQGGEVPTPQPKGTWPDGQEWVEAFSCRPRGAKSVCSVAKRPGAPWKRACSCHGEQGSSVPTQGPPVPPPRGSSCGTGRTWPGAARSRDSFPSAEHDRSHSLCSLVVIAALGVFPSWGADCLASNSPATPDFCLPTLTRFLWFPGLFASISCLFSLWLTDNANKLGRNACISLYTYLWIHVFVSLPTSKQ